MRRNPLKYPQGIKVGVGVAALAALTFGALGVGCHHDTETKITPVTAAAVQPVGISFTDTTKQAGIDFRHVNGAFGQKWLPETMGSGCAWIDYDGDGYQDLFLVNSREWTDAERAAAHQPPNAQKTPPATCKLYHNNG